MAGKAGQRLRQAATPDDHTAGNAKREFELAELVGRIGNFYTKKGLSPPFALRDDAREWRSLSQDEIVALINKHFDDCRRFYTSGSGDREGLATAQRGTLRVGGRTIRVERYRITDAGRRAIEG